MIAIRAERLRVQTETTHRQPTLTFGKCKEMSSGTFDKMNFHLFIKSGFIHNQKDAPKGHITLKSRAPF